MDKMVMIVAGHEESGIDELISCVGDRYRVRKVSITDKVEEALSVCGWSDDGSMSSRALVKDVVDSLRAQGHNQV